MKNLSIVKRLLLTIIGISLFAVTAEAETALNQIVWCGSCLTICASSALILNAIEKKEEQK